MHPFSPKLPTLLYLQWITNKVLLCSTGNFAQCYVATWMGRGFGGKWIHVHAWLSPLLCQHCWSSILQYKIKCLKTKKIYNNFFWLTSLCITGSRFIHLTRTDWSSFSFIAEQYSIAYMYCVLYPLICSGHLDCFHALAFVNSSTVSIWIYVSFIIVVFSEYIETNTTL